MQSCKNLVDSQQILGLICKAKYVLKSEETKVHEPNLTSNGNEKNFRWMGYHIQKVLFKNYSSPHSENEGRSQVKGN